MVSPVSGHKIIGPQTPEMLGSRQVFRTIFADSLAWLHLHEVADIAPTEYGIDGHPFIESALLWSNRHTSFELVKIMRAT